MKQEEIDALVLRKYEDLVGLCSDGASQVAIKALEEKLDDLAPNYRFGPMAKARASQLRDIRRREAWDGIVATSLSLPVAIITATRQFYLSLWKVPA